MFLRNCSWQRKTTNRSLASTLGMTFLLVAALVHAQPPESSATLEIRAQNAAYLAQLRAQNERNKCAQSNGA